jgi:hypothetical protein
VSIQTRVRQYQELMASFTNSGKSELFSLVKVIRGLEQKSKIDLIMKDVPDLVRESMEGLTRVAKIVGDLKNFSRADQLELKAIDVTLDRSISAPAERSPLQWFLFLCRDWRY